jgi:hypothetical protein
MVLEFSVGDASHTLVDATSDAVAPRPHGCHATTGFNTFLVVGSLDDDLMPGWNIVCWF